MTVKELINQLNDMPNDIEVRIMNIEIESNEMCPTFELSSIELIKNRKQSFVTLQYSDDIFISDEVKINNA